MGSPLPPVPNTALCRVLMETGTGGSMLHQCQNVLFFNWATGTATQTDIDNIAQNLMQGYQHIFDGTFTGGTHYISDDTTLTGVTVTDLDSPTAPFSSLTTSTPGAASQISLAQSAMLFRKHVLRRFRGGHGRVYFPGITPDNTTDGRTWTSGAQADLLAAFTQVIGYVSIGHYTGGYPNISMPTLVVVSYYDRNVNPVPPYRRTTPVVDHAASITVDAVIRSQRRRVRLTPTPS